MFVKLIVSYNNIFIIFFYVLLWFYAAAPGNAHLFLGISFKHNLNATYYIKDAGTAQFVIYTVAALIVLHQSGIFQHAQVLGHGRDVGADHLGQLVDTALLLVQLLKDEEPRRVTHGF